MTIRFVVRSRNIHKTPILLSRSLGAQRTIAWPPKSHSYKPNYWTDFFTYYPPIEEVSFNATTQHNTGSLDFGYRSFRQCRGFQSKTKPNQRFDLATSGFTVPPTAWATGSIGSLSGLEQFVIRPLRHYGGVGFRISDANYFSSGLFRQSGECGPENSCGSQNSDLWNPETEYISGFYPKDHEYRIICVYGEPLITLIKKVPEETPNTLPWNHACGAFFVTVTEWQNNRLRHTNIYDVIKESELIKSFDICALDVMYRNDRSYAVSELNICPALTIPENLSKVVNYVNSTSKVSRYEHS